MSRRELVHYLSAVQPWRQPSHRTPMDSASVVSYNPESLIDQSVAARKYNTRSAREPLIGASRNHQAEIQAQIFSRRRQAMRSCAGTLLLAALCGFILFEWARWVTKFEHPDPEFESPSH